MIQTGTAWVPLSAADAVPLVNEADVVVALDRLITDRPTARRVSDPQFVAVKTSTQDQEHLMPFGTLYAVYEADFEVA